MEQTMLIAVLIAALVGLFLFDTVRLRRMQVQRDAAKEEVAEVKTEFLSRISHEIKTPMNVIVGATALGLEETEHPERMEECLNRIRGASEFLMGLLNDLVDMSKIENGKFHLHPKPYSFTEFLNEVENMMEPMCERKWIRFHMPHEDININMMVDPVRFFQIFFNLLSNAVKFTPEGGEVTFRICNYATHNNQFCADYVVSDNGMGMSEEFQQILFQPFTQESVNQGERGNGAGLGLAIVRSIVDLMGGTITVKSEPQKGTEIKVHLEIEIAELEKAVTGYEQSQKSAEKFIALIDKYENFDTLTNTMLNEFVEKILVHERARKGSQDTTQEIEIYFNFLGRYIPPSLQPVPLTPEEQEELRKKEERKDRLHQNYLKRKASGAQKRYEDKIKAKKKAEMDAKKALIRAEDMKKGVFSTVGQLPKEEPRKGSIAASAAV